MPLSILQKFIKYYYAECIYAECLYVNAHCCYLQIQLSVVMLRVIMCYRKDLTSWWVVQIRIISDFPADLDQIFNTGPVL